MADHRQPVATETSAQSNPVYVDGDCRVPDRDVLSGARHEYKRAWSPDQDNALFNLLNMFSGGAFYRFSIFAMSVTPYITASIIVQLLQSGVVPGLRSGRRKASRVDRS